MNLKSEKRKLFFLMKNYNFSQRLNDLSLYIDILICKYDDIQSNTFLNDFKNELNTNINSSNLGQNLFYSENLNLITDLCDYFQNPQEVLLKNQLQHIHKEITIIKQQIAMNTEHLNTISHSLDEIIKNQQLKL